MVEEVMINDMLNSEEGWDVCIQVIVGRLLAFLIFINVIGNSLTIVAHIKHKKAPYSAECVYCKFSNIRFDCWNKQPTILFSVHCSVLLLAIWLCVL